MIDATKKTATMNTITSIPLNAVYAVTLSIFPSFQANDNNLMIVHDPSDRPSDDEKVMQLWKKFTETDSE